MVRIRVTLREIELLYLCYERKNIAINFSVNDSHIIIDNNELTNLDIMFNCILDTFLEIGLLENDEPNKIGFELENLNVKVNHEYVLLNR